MRRDTLKSEVIQQSITVETPREVYKDFPQFLEKIGRVCYKSEDKISEGSSEKFIRRIIKAGHEAVLEHASITIRFTTDRAMSHALVRHRHCAFMQESTHYINYHKKDVLQVVDQAGLDDEADVLIWEHFMEVMAETYGALSSVPHAVTRSIFPNALKTELIITTNLREWRWMMRLRTESGCHPQMKQLMGKVVDWFKEELPIFVEDING